MEYKFCCLCDSKVEGFLPWSGAKPNSFMEILQCIGSDVINFQCPKCNCTDRDRHLWLYINKLGIFEAINENTRILHVAPEFPIINRLSEKTKNIIAGDLHPEKYSNNSFQIKKINLTRIDFQDNSFDIFIANHILEHVENYEDALNEIYRVLNHRGFAILQTPFSPVIYKNFEDRMIDTDEKRDIFYGQNNHVRLFGLQLFDDIKKVGFNLHYVEHEQLLGEYDAVKYGVNPREEFIIAVK